MLIGKIEQVGIEIIDVENKFYAAKAPWLDRIVNLKSITHRPLSNILQQHNTAVFYIIKTNGCNPNYSDFLRRLNCCSFIEMYLMPSIVIKQKKSIGSVEFLSHFYWNNILFQYNSNPLCLNGWSVAYYMLKIFLMNLGNCII